MAEKESGNKSVKAQGRAGNKKVEAEAPTASGAAPDMEAEAAAPPSEPSLEAQLAEARREVQEAQNRYLYAIAELQNLKRRMDRDLAERLQYANEQMLRDLVPVVDHLQLALDAARESADVETLRRGVEIILGQLESVLAKYGVSPIGTTGETFDPSLHEAIERVESPAPEGTIVEEAKRGYRLHDRTLRAAQVKVAVRPREHDEQEGEHRPEGK
jgi:molecular chaperone GrpE